MTKIHFGGALAGLMALGALGACSNAENYSAIPASEIAGLPTPTSEVVVTAAEQDCLVAVGNKVGFDEVTTISVTQVPTGTNVMVAVPEVDAPWSCTTDAEGVVVEMVDTASI